MAAIDGAYDHNDEDAPRWLAENLQGLYQVSKFATCFHFTHCVVLAA